MSPHMSSEYGVLRPTSGRDLLASFRRPCKCQRVLRLGSVTARHSSSGRQPNFATLNRAHHLYSAGRPSRWALAHISSFVCFCHFIFAFVVLDLVSSVLSRWRGGVTVRHLGLRSVGRGFKSCSRQRCVTTLGKLFTPMCLCHQAV